MHQCYSKVGQIRRTDIVCSANSKTSEALPNTLNMQSSQNGMTAKHQSSYCRKSRIGIVIFADSDRSGCEFSSSRISCSFRPSSPFRITLIITSLFILREITLISSKLKKTYLSLAGYTTELWYISSIGVTHKLVYAHVLGNDWAGLCGLRTVQKSQKQDWHLCPEVGYRDPHNKDAEKACIPSTRRKGVENAKPSPKNPNLHHYLLDSTLATRPEMKEVVWLHEYLELMTSWTPMRPFVMSSSEKSSYTICVPGWFSALAVTFGEATEWRSWVRENNHSLWMFICTGRDD